MAFVKLHCTILDSSIWLESPSTRLVWITMLAMADGDGVVQASVGGLAHRSRVTRQECQEALQLFLGPDPDSRDGTTGERIEKVAGGWLLLNHSQYRERQTTAQEKTAARVRKHRAKRQEERTCNDETAGNAPSASASASASSETAKPKSASVKKRPVAADRPDSVPQQVWDDWLSHRKGKRCGVSVTVLAGFEREAKKAGMSLTQAIEHSITQGWQGFRADWVANGKATKTGTKLGTAKVNYDDVDYSAGGKITNPNTPKVRSF